MKMRKPREISNDPEFPYQVGRLLGAAEGAALRLRATGDPVDRLASEHLIGIVSWFVVRQSGSEPLSYDLPPSLAPAPTSEMPTRVMTPSD